LQEGIPLLDKLEFKIIPDESTRIMALETGEIDLDLNIPESEVLRLKENQEIKIYQSPCLRTVFYMFGPTVEPFNDKAVRKAVSLAIDQELIAQTVLEGLHKPATRPTFAPNVWGVPQNVPEMRTNLKEAETVLDDAGWELGRDGIRMKDGKPLAFNLWTTSGRYPQDSIISEYVASILKQIGIQTEVRTAEWGAYRDMIFNRELGMFLFGAGVSTGDVDYVAYLLFHSSQNYCQGWTEVDELLVQARINTDSEMRKELYREIFTIIGEEYMWVPIYWQSMLRASDQKVKEYKLHPTEALIFEEVWIDE
jgi:peptide/nickel transport system substrate-binding protein